MGKAWEAFEVVYLINNAGFCSVQSMAKHLDRDPMEVETVLCSLGVDAVLLCPEVFWCDSCATYRTELNKNGICRVCQLKGCIEREEEAISEELKKLPYDLQDRYSNSETLKGTKATPAPLPLKEAQIGTNRKQKRLAEVAYLASMEQWQIKNMQRLYNASKTRLKRIREHLGTNPRKGNK